MFIKKTYYSFVYLTASGCLLQAAIRRIILFRGIIRFVFQAANADTKANAAAFVTKRLLYLLSFL
ncbi:MAG: hypothetical protein HYV28_14590 [Ignavibacteriales bacterium]|nr:hypothetical protein [Ignavibacteriales bacterium]